MELAFIEKKEVRKTNEKNSRFLHAIFPVGLDVDAKKLVEDAEEAVLH
jgi:hypothetical protein